MNAIDTNVLLYYVDSTDVNKQSKAEALLTSLKNDAATILVWQVAIEFAAGLVRWQHSGKIRSQAIVSYRQTVEAMFPVVLPQSNFLDQAFDLRDRHRLSYWDSLLLAACAEAGVDTLYSEDLSDGAVYDSVKVVNPFV